MDESERLTALILFAVVAVGVVILALLGAVSERHGKVGAILDDLVRRVRGW